MDHSICTSNLVYFHENISYIGSSKQESCFDKKLHNGSDEFEQKFSELSRAEVKKFQAESSPAGAF